MADMKHIQGDAREKMNKAIEALESNLSVLRTGRANPGILKKIVVDYYGSTMPIDQVEISVEDYLEQARIIKEKEEIVLENLPEAAQKALNRWQLVSQLESNPPFLFQRLKALQEYAESAEYQKLFE